MKFTVYVNGGKCATGFMESQDAKIWEIVLDHEAVYNIIDERNITSRSIGFFKNDDHETECELNIWTDERDRVWWVSP